MEQKIDKDFCLVIGFNDKKAHIDYHNGVHGCHLDMYFNYMPSAFEAIEVEQKINDTTPSIGKSPKFGMLALMTYAYAIYLSEIKRNQKNEI